jgi:hypothetical protein
VQRVDRLLVELELLLERIDLVSTHEATLLRVLEEGGKRRVGFKGISAQGKFSQHLFSEGWSGTKARIQPVLRAPASVVITGNPAIFFHPNETFT